MTIQTDEYGECVQLWQAELFLKGQGLRFVNKRGALVFRYPNQEAREILPVSIQGKGWFYSLIELRRDYQKPAPEIVTECNAP